MNEWSKDSSLELHSVLKSLKMSHLNFSILAFLINFCPLKCKRSSLRSLCWMRHFQSFSNIVYKIKKSEGTLLLFAFHLLLWSVMNMPNNNDPKLLYICMVQHELLHWEQDLRNNSFPVNAFIYLRHNYASKMAFLHHKLVSIKKTGKIS